MKKCKICGEKVDNGLETPIGYLCYDCADDNDYHECERCGNVFEGTYTDLGEMVYICDDCLNSIYVKCDGCGDNYSPDFPLHVLDDGKHLCEDCYCKYIEETKNKK